MSEKQEVFRINAVAYWANTDKPNAMSGDYSIDLCRLSKAAVAKLESVNLDVKNDPEKKADQLDYVSAKSKYQIRVYDADGEEMKGVRVGNGSKVTATLRPYDWTYKNKKGTSAGILKLVVHELVEYTGAADDADAPLIEDEDIPF